MKNEFIKLTNNFLYRDDVPKGDIIDKINRLIENVFLDDDLVLAQNIMNTYRGDLNDFCVVETNEYRKKVIPCFTAIIALLNNQD